LTAIDQSINYSQSMLRPEVLRYIGFHFASNFWKSMGLPWLQTYVFGDRLKFGLALKLDLAQTRENHYAKQSKS